MIQLDYQTIMFIFIKCLKSFGFAFMCLDRLKEKFKNKNEETYLSSNVLLYHCIINLIWLLFKELAKEYPGAFFDSFL